MHIFPFLSILLWFLMTYPTFFPIVHSCRQRKSGMEHLVKWRDLPYDLATWEKIEDDSFVP